MTHRTILAAFIAVILFLGTGTAAMKASTPRIPDKLKVQHEVTGSSRHYIYLNGLGGLDLPENFTIRIVLPADFSLELPDEFSGDLDVTHDGEVQVREADK